MKLSLLLNPFDKQTDKRLIVASILISAFGIIMAILLNTRFDGVLDVHFAEVVAPTQACIDFTVNTIALVVLLFAAAILVNRKTRPVDILLTVLIARLPYYLLTFFNIDGTMYTASEKMLTAVQEGAFPVAGDDMGLITLFTLASLTCMAWFGLLLCNGFRVATNSKGAKGIIFAILTILIAEVISKIIFLNISF
jgi:hypothetical protein